jgi:hypothetical protein
MSIRVFSPFRIVARWARNIPPWMMYVAVVGGGASQIFLVLLFVVEPQRVAIKERVSANAQSRINAERAQATSKKLVALRQDARRREEELGQESFANVDLLEVSARSFVLQALYKAGGKLVTFERRDESKIDADLVLFFQGEGPFTAIHHFLSDLSASSMPLSLHNVSLTNDVSSSHLLSISFLTSLRLSRASRERCSQ